MKKISCIIPAYNEEKQIASVLDAVLEAKQKIPMEIIVIDDGSDDRTPSILRKYKDVQVLTNAPNRGKSYSIARGLEVSKGDYILMLDSDLIGLTASDILALLQPIKDGIADVTMSVRRNSFAHMRLMKLDFITGERAFPRDLIIDRVESIKNLRRFGLELYLNDLIIKHKYRVKTIYWKNVSHTMKRKKRGFYPSLKADTKMMRDMLSTVSISGIARQHVALMKSLRKGSSNGNDK